MSNKLFILLCFSFIFASCKKESKPEITPIKAKETEQSLNINPQSASQADSSINQDTKQTYTVNDVADISQGENAENSKSGAKFFEEIYKWKHGIIVDMKYATTDNFTKKKIYNCSRCYLRPEAAVALIHVQEDLKTTYGYALKVFDCFRPRPFQQRLWDIVPNADYVTPPAKGSMHSRGLAVDLTMVDENGKELDMGTAFDYFGKEAHTDFKGHSAEVNKNRQILTSIMQKYGFKGIRTEWWHFSLQAKYPLDEWVWDCK